MRKDRASDPSDRALGDTRKDGVPEFGEDAGADPREAVCRRFRVRTQHSGGDTLLRTAENDGASDGKETLSGRGVDFDIEGVDDVFEEERHLHIQELRVRGIQFFRSWSFMSEDDPPSRRRADQGRARLAAWCSSRSLATRLAAAS